MSVITVNSQLSDRKLGISFQDSKPSEISMKQSYTVILQKDEDDRIVVRSPDLQGVVTDGADMNEAIRNAIEAVDAIVESRGLNKDYNLIVIQRPRV
ncbi:MAG: type II toxin-antitoxin system HicB family antitoxin [Candidatus Nitrosopolaris sp.]|jgi:predicted RNase H-like HicB family nuclease